MPNAKYCGVIPPIVTPVDKHEKVDEGALRNVVQRCRETGLHGVFVAGSNGECMALTQRERNRAIRTVLDEAGGTYPVVCGVMDTSTLRVIENIKALEEMGGKVAVVTPVFYARHATPDETIIHFEEILEHTSLELMIYNIPMFTGCKLSASTIIKISELSPRVIGVKDTCGDFPQFVQLLRHFKGSTFSVLQGATNLAAASMLLGADGYVPSLAPVFPIPHLKVYEYGRSGDIEKTLEWNDVLMDVCRLYPLARSQTSSTKYAMSKLGFMTSRVIRPSEPITQEEADKIDAFMELRKQYM